MADCGCTYGAAFAFGAALAFFAFGCAAGGLLALVFLPFAAGAAAGAPPPPLAAQAALNCASSQMSVPFASALLAFAVPLTVATRMSVFLETEFVTLAPACSALFWFARVGEV